MDMDTSLILFDKDGNKIDYCFFDRRELKNEAEELYIKHSGDDRTGEGGEKDDDETIDMYLDKIPEKVHSIYPVVTIYNKTDSQQFDDV